MLARRLATLVMRLVRLAARGALLRQFAHGARVAYRSAAECKRAFSWALWRRGFGAHALCGF